MPRVSISNTAPRETRLQNGWLRPTKRGAPAGAHPLACAAKMAASELLICWLPGRSGGAELPVSCGENGVSGGGRRSRQDEVLESLPQRRLLDLAGGGMRNLVDKNNLVRHPPARDLALHERQDLVACRRDVLFEDDDQQWPLVPFWMANADHRRLRDLGVSDRKVLDVDGRDPLAAGLDDVLGAVRDVHIAVAIDGRDVAGIEVAFSIENIIVLPVIGACNGRPTHLEAAERPAIPGQLLAGIISDLHLHHERRMSLQLLDDETRFADKPGVFRLECAYGAQRAHLGHAPGVHHLDAVVLLEAPGHRARAGGAADHDPFEVGQLVAGRGEMLQQHEPDRWHAAAAADPVTIEQIVDRGAVEP